MLWNFRKGGKCLEDQEWRKKMRKIFGEEKSLLARVLGWFELVVQLDNYLFFQHPGNREI